MALAEILPRTDVVRDFVYAQPQFEAILRQLKPLVNRQAYSLVIGDDTSGRLPALIIGKTINAHYQSLGIDKLPIVFVAGGNMMTKEGIEDQMSARFRAYPQLDRTKRLLLVTDHVSSGVTVGRFEGAFIKWSEGVRFDVAALTTDNYRDYYALELFRGSKFFVAKETEGPPRFYGKPELSGLFRHPKPPGVMIARFPDRIRLREARAEVNKMVGRLLPTLLSE